MMRVPGIVGLAMLLLVSAALVVPRGAAREASGDAVRQEGTLSILDIVVLTEDLAEGDSLTAGCDAISIHDYRSGRAIDRGYRHISVGRVTARADLSLIAATHSNGCGWPGGGLPSNSPNPDCRPWLALRQPHLPEFSRVNDGFYLGTDPAMNGGLAFIDDGSLLIASARPKVDRRTYIRPAAPFGVARLAFPARVAARGSIRPVASIGTAGLIGEILHVPHSGVAYLVGIDGTIMTVSDDTLQRAAPDISFPTPVSPMGGSTQTRPPVESFHASISADARYVIVNGMASGNAIVIDLQQASASRQGLGTDVEFVGGIDVNKGWVNSGLVAVHGGSRVLVYSFDSPPTLELVGELPVTIPRFAPSRTSAGIYGPELSLAWTTDGSHLIARAEDGPAEFWVIEVSDEGRSLEHVASLTACTDSSNLGNGVWTANGLITATPSPTPPFSTSPTPSSTQRPSVTPTRTRTSTPMPTSSATATSTVTPVPGPIYLPLALTESCDPTQVRIDVALVIDASSSMREPAAPGGAKTKLQAAREAVGSFLDLLALDEGDQAAIVSFHGDAWLHAPLTADRTALDLALAAVETGQQTRIDRGLERATEALLDDATRDPDNELVLVLLTDGRANPVPVAVAVERAAEAKDAGIALFTIGLGDDVEAEALRAMASEPAFFLRAPTADVLDGAYREVARSIPCPPSAYWGGG